MREEIRLTFAAWWTLAWTLFAGAALASELTVSSPAFEEGGDIPFEYSCKGGDISPEITWSRAPEGTKSFALICEDPDAPGDTWVHWVLFNIPADSSGLSENACRSLPCGAVEGSNSWGRNTYGGPCPPSGTHRYYFRVYALDVTLNLFPNATSECLRRAMKDHILAEGELMGRFSK